MRNVSVTFEEKIKNIHFMVHNLFFYEVTWKNIVESDRPQITNGACALHDG